jgi:hypothetical protein
MRQNQFTMSKKSLEHLGIAVAAFAPFHFALAKNPQREFPSRSVDRSDRGSAHFGVVVEWAIDRFTALL